MICELANARREGISGTVNTSYKLYVKGIHFRLLPKKLLIRSAAIDKNINSECGPR
jgi:hypothetical protein